MLSILDEINNYPTSINKKRKIQQPHGRNEPRSLQNKIIESVLIMGVLDIECVFIGNDKASMKMVPRTAALVVPSFEGVSEGDSSWWWDIQPPKLEKDLNDAEKVQNSYSYAVHRISFDPIVSSSATHQIVSLDHFKQDLNEIWIKISQSCESRRTKCLAYKGGFIELKLLNELSIPSFDIGMSKGMVGDGITVVSAPNINRSHVQSLLKEFPSCGVYHTPTTTFHCCLQEVSFYLNWLQENFPFNVWDGFQTEPHQQRTQKSTTTTATTANESLTDGGINKRRRVSDDPKCTPSLDVSNKRFFSEPARSSTCLSLERGRTISFRSNEGFVENHQLPIIPNVSSSSSNGDGDKCVVAPPPSYEETMRTLENFQRAPAAMGVPANPYRKKMYSVTKPSCVHKPLVHATAATADGNNILPSSSNSSGSWVSRLNYGEVAQRNTRFGESAALMKRKPQSLSPTVVYNYPPNSFLPTSHYSAYNGY